MSATFTVPTTFKLSVVLDDASWYEIKPDPDKPGWYWFDKRSAPRKTIHHTTAINCDCLGFQKCRKPARNCRHTRLIRKLRILFA